MALGTVNQLLSGTTDVTGSFTTNNLNPTPTQWAALKLVANTTGNAKWAVLVGGIAKAWGRGDRVDIPFFIQPGQLVKIQIIAAQVNSPVLGEIVGISGDTLQEISPFITFSPNSITMDTANPQLGPIVTTSPVGVVTHYTLHPPPGTVAIAWVPFQTNDVGGFTLTGKTTLYIYYSDSAAGNPNFPDSFQVGVYPIVVSISQIDEPDGFDFALDGTGTSGTGPIVYVYFCLSQAIVNVRTTAGQPPLDINESQSLPSAFTQLLKPSIAVDVNNPSLGNNTSITLLSAVANKRPYLYTVALGFNTISGNITIEDGSGVVLWRATFIETAGPDSKYYIDMGGVAGTLNQSLLLFNRSGGTISAIGAVSVNQAN